MRMIVECFILTLTGIQFIDATYACSVGWVSSLAATIVRVVFDFCTEVKINLNSSNLTKITLLFVKMKRKKKIIC